MKKLLLLFACLLMTAAGSAATKTINPDGSGDYISFTEFFTALTSEGITEALNVEVSSGTYYESAAVSGMIPGADAENMVHIYPADGDVTVNGEWGAYALGFSGTAFIHLEGLDLMMDMANEFSSGALMISGSTQIDVSHCRIHQSGFVGALIQESQHIRMWNNFIYDTAAANLSIAMCGADANIEIWNNSFHYDYPWFGGFFGQPAQCIAITESSANVHNNALHKAVIDEGDGGPMDSSKGIINIDFMGGSMETFFEASNFDHNVYFTEPGTKLFQVGFMEFYTDLESLNAAYGFAANSVFGDPQYNDPENGDLTISTNESACYMTGEAAEWFSDDFSHEPRDHWDIGADFVTMPALSGTVTIDAAGTGDFTSFSDLFADLTVTGIDGPLNVEVAAGTYYESAAVSGMIPGADAENMVHIYPADGDVTVNGEWGAYALGFSGTAFIHLEGLDLMMDMANEFSSGALMISGSTQIDVSHCRIHQSGFVGALIQESQHIRMWNNFIYDTAAANLSIAMCGADANIEIWNNSFHYDYPWFGGFFGQPAQCIAITESSANVHNNALHKAVIDEGDGGPMDSSKGIINIDFMGGSMETFFEASNFDHNVYFTEPGTKLFQVGFMEFYTDLESLNAAYGFAANSVFGDPLFDDPENGDLTISTNESACYMAGEAAEWFSDDFSHEPREHWDIGADYVTMPALSGTVTIDAAGTGDFTSFSDLFADLTVTGIDGPLNVEVAAGTYYESAAVSGMIPGADAENMVHIYPADGDVTVNGEWGAYALGFSGTAFIHLEGLDLMMDMANEFSSGALMISGSTQIDVSHCRIHQSGFVGALIQESQHIRMWNNFIYDTAAANLSIAMCGADANIEIWNNSFHYDYPWFGGFFGQPAQCIAITESSANVHNNALHKAVIDEGDGGPMDSSKGIINIDFMGGSMETFFEASNFDHNVYFTEPGTKLFQVGFMEFYTDLESLNAAYGFAANSVFGDPQYNDPENGDLTISTNESACYMTGEAAEWFSDDFSHEPRDHWDIGADFVLSDGNTDLLPVENLTSEIQDQTSILLTWEAPFEPAESPVEYNVYRDEVLIAAVTVPETSYLDENLPEGIYEYFVTAVYNAGESEPSETLNVEITIIPAYGDLTRIDIPWILSASSDSYYLVGGIEGSGGGFYWNPEDGVVQVTNQGDASDISDSGIIAGVNQNHWGELEACWWDVNNMIPYYIGTVEGGTSSTVNAISNEGTSIVGLAWYSGGIGSAKAYKWTPESGSVLLPEVLDYADSRADCISGDGSLIGGYAGNPGTFVWQPAVWTEDELILLPTATEDWSVVSAISPNGEWYSGYNGNKGIVWHDQEIADVVGDEMEFIQTHFRTVTDDGWAGGETANWNTMVSEPVLWNPVSGLMNAVDYFESQGVVIPEDYELFRVRRISNDHLTFVCNGTDLNTYMYQSCIVRLPGPHGVGNFQASADENDVRLTWYFDEEFSPAENIIILRDGITVATLENTASEFLDIAPESGVHEYEIYVTYSQYQNSVSNFQTVTVEEAECIADGDANLDGGVNVLDAVLIVGHILGTTEFSDENICHSDLNEDMVVDILDLVILVDIIVGLDRTDMAKSAEIILESRTLSLQADGSVGAVQIRISHEPGIVLEMTRDALLAEYATEGASSVVIIAAPENGILLTADQTFDVLEVTAASVDGYIDIDVVKEYKLLSCYPNPFNPVTRLQYKVPSDGIVQLSIYNLQGQQSAILVNAHHSTGSYSVEWNGTTDDGMPLPSGVYFVQLTTPTHSASSRITLLK